MLIEGIWSDVQTREGTPHQILLDNSTKVQDTAHNFCTKGGDTAHNFQSKGGDTAHNIPTKGEDTEHNFQTLAVGWVAGWDMIIIMPLRGSILQAETCQILS